MTEQETEIKRVISYIRSCRNAGIDTTITIDKSRNHLILNALEEIQQYRALGTLEELREAREKQVPKKPIDCVEKYLTGRKNYFCRCSCCDGVVDDTFDKYCRFCGQAIDWSDAE